MKKTILGLFAFVCAFSGISCSEDDLSGTSVIKPEQTTETPLDAWLYKNYIEPYNIEFRYRYEDMAVSYTHLGELSSLPFLKTR